MKRSDLWTADDIERLKAMWKDGLSSGRIVVEFGGRFSRSAIAGKISRLRAKLGNVSFDARGTNHGREKARTHGTLGALVAKKRRAARKAKDKAPTPVVKAPPLAPFVTRQRIKRDSEEAPPFVPPIRVTLMNLTSTSCRWPLWNTTGRLRFMPPSEIVFCGLAKDEDSASYCPFHRHLNRGVGTRSELEATRDAQRAAARAA